MKMPFKLFYPEGAESIAGSLGGSKDGLSESRTENNPFDTAPSGGGNSGKGAAPIPPQLQSPNPDRPPNPMDLAEMAPLPTRVGTETPAPEKLHETPAAPVEQKPVVPQAITEERIAEISAQVAAKYGAPKVTEQAAPQAPQITQEQFNERFGVVSLDAKGYQDIMGFQPENPGQVKALNDFGQGLVRQTMRLMTYLQEQNIQRLESKITGQISPVIQSQQAAEVQRLQSDFYTKHPDLKDYEGLVVELADKLDRDVKAGRKQFSGTREQKISQAFEHVASEVRRLARLNAPNGGSQGSPAQQTTQQQTTSQPSRRMAPLSQGGQAAGSNGATSSKISDAQFVFG